MVETKSEDLFSTFEEEDPSKNVVETINKHSRRFDSVNETLLNAYFKKMSDEVLKICSRTLYHGQLENLKKFMTLDETLAAAIGLDFLKKDKLSLKEKREKFVQTHSVYDIINIANEFSFDKKYLNAYHLLNYWRADQFKSANLNDIPVEKWNSLQKQYWIVQAKGELNKFGLEERLNLLTPEETTTFKSKFVEYVKEFANESILENSYAKQFPEKVKEMYVIKPNDRGSLIKTIVEKIN